MAMCKSLGLVRPLITSTIRLHAPNITPVAGIVSKTARDPNYKRYKPWPYKTKKYTFLHYLYFDGTLKRMDENTKVITVDGNIGAGKTTLAKYLAEELDMIYVPEPDMSQLYITKYGYDLRELDPYLPESFKHCDLKKFYEDPHHRNVTLFQYKMFALRLVDYINTLEHVLNTGQGAVMDRSVFSDLVFMEAMYNAGYVEKEYRDHYFEVYNNCVIEMMRPNVIIYLDITPEVALERIKQRNDPMEVNSKVLTLDYLSTIERAYKDNLLKKLGGHSEIVIYDWSEFGDLEVVVEDIERLDLDTIDEYSDKFHDWRFRDDWEWSWQRYMYSTQKHRLLHNLRVFRPRLTKIYHTPDDTDTYLNLLDKVPGGKYATGFNLDAGDKGVLFKRYNSKFRDNLEFFRPQGSFLRREKETA